MKQAPSSFNLVGACVKLVAAALWLIFLEPVPTAVVAS